MTAQDIARISRVFNKMDVQQPIAGTIELNDGVLSMAFDAAINVADDAYQSLARNHLNVHIDPNSSEARRSMHEGMAHLEIDVLDPLWKHSEMTPPSKPMVKL